MDKTPEYIEMCSKATEIQAHRQPQYHTDYRRTYPFVEGDYIWDGDGVRIYVEDNECAGVAEYVDERRGRYIEIDTSGFCEGDSYLPKCVIWLPRQDQLQEISRIASGIDWLQQLMCFTINYAYVPSVLPQPSTESLALRFVMHEKYGKLWYSDKKEWVKE